MKIFIKNLGPIASFEFDLTKDLNIIFGKNNIGKSYAITTVYLILKNLVDVSTRFRPFEVELFFIKRSTLSIEEQKGVKGFSTLISEIELKIEEALKNQKFDEFDISSHVETLLKTIINLVLLENLENSFKNSFSSIEDLPNKISKEKLEISLIYNDFVLNIENKGNNLIVKDLKVTKKIVVKRASSSRKPHSTDGKFIIYHAKKSNKFDVIGDCIERFYFSFKNEVSSIINNVYFLPASRSGLYQALSTFSAVMAELSKSRTFLTANKIELPNISEPVSDYFLNLSNIGTKTKNDYKDIVNEIESEILKGKVLFNRDTKKIVFSQDKIHAELDLSFTSSMISEIAPIVAYLKYIINKDNESPRQDLFVLNNKPGSYSIIFIEEPEAHLHPEVQVQLMEIFSKLIDKKVKVIMTSHSNYMFNKLSNLILERKISHERVGSYLMTAGSKGSVVDSIKMQADDQGMNDENFADVAEKLYEERIMIYDKLNLSV